jgi:hypothetical protein
MTSPYEDALWKELVDAHGEALSGGHLPPPSRRHRPWAAVGGTALVAAAATGGVLVYSAVSNTTPAYAVSRNSNGSVNIVLRRVAGLHGLNARLGAMHIRAKAVLLADGCPPSPAVLQGAMHGSGRVHWTKVGRTVVRPQVLRASRMRIVLVRRLARGLTLTTVTGRADQAVPSCVGQVPITAMARQAKLPAGGVLSHPPRVILRCGPLPTSGGPVTNGSSTATNATSTATNGATTATTTVPAQTATNGSSTATTITPSQTATPGNSRLLSRQRVVVACGGSPPVAGGANWTTTNGTVTASQTTTSP